MSYVVENWGWLIAGWLILSSVVAIAAGKYLDTGDDDD